MLWLILFVVSILLVLYPLVIYPGLLYLLAPFINKQAELGKVEGDVAHIITVYNEESRIRKKIENALAVAPLDRHYEIIVASDGSDDGTQAIVSEFKDQGVRWLQCPRRGKEFAQREAIRSTEAPWIVFSDASTHLEPSAIDLILRPFYDPKVGAVSGTDRLDRDGTETGEGFYVRYEMAVRRAEARVGTLVGLSGCFFAARREVAMEILEGVPSDMGAAWISIAQGKRAVAADDAVAIYTATTEAGKEFRRKRRTALRGIRGMFAYRSAFSTDRLIEAWQLFSHKTMRFLTPFFFLLGLTALGMGAWSGELWATYLWPGAVFGLVLAMLATWKITGLARLTPLRAGAFFLVVNAALLAAWWVWLRGGKDAAWTPTSRKT